MHAARLARSPRLQAVLAALSDGAERSTLDLVHEAGVCAVNSCIAELRANGYAITCRVGKAPGGRRIWLYRLVTPTPKEDTA